MGALEPDLVALNQLAYAPNGSDGATVGFNYDQTIAPGESITYRWYAHDHQIPPVTVWDMGGPAEQPTPRRVRPADRRTRGLRVV